MVLFAGIAAEALVYGEAEGGENDENLFRSISVLLEPPLSVAQVRSCANHTSDDTSILLPSTFLAPVYRLLSIANVYVLLYTADVESSQMVCPSILQSAQVAQGGTSGRC